MKSFYELYHQSLVRGKNGKTISMSLRRKSAPGIGNFSDVTRPMSVDKLKYVRQRARTMTRGAQMREWVLSNPFAAIRKLVIAR